MGTKKYFGLVTIKRAAEILEMSVTQVRYHTDKGNIPVTFYGNKGRRLYSEEVLIQLKRQKIQEVFNKVSPSVPEAIFITDAPTLRPLDSDALNVVSALISLGFSKLQATEIALRARSELPGGTSLELMSRAMDILNKEKEMDNGRSGTGGPVG